MGGLGAKERAELYGPTRADAVTRPERTTRPVNECRVAERTTDRKVAKVALEEITALPNDTSLCGKPYSFCAVRVTQSRRAEGARTGRR
jgi:hypothetical protein